eukprot:gene22753-biopygen23521
MKDLADMAPATNPFVDGVRPPETIVTMQGSATTASAVLSAVLIQVTEGDAFDLVRRCENDGVKAYRKLRARVVPQLFGQLAASMHRLTRHTVNSTSDPVKQLSSFADLQSYICRYGGERLDWRTIEVVALAFAVSALLNEYATVVADLGREAKPTFDLLLQRSDFFYVNVLQEKNPLRDYAAPAEDIDTAAVAKGLLGDRRRQAEERKVNEAKHLICAVCSGGHSSESCWLMYPQKMEEFIKNNPAKESLCRERLAKRKKRMPASKSGEVIEKAAAAVSSLTEKMTDVEIWEAEEHDEVPCACVALQNCGGQPGVYTGDVLHDSWVYEVAQSEGDLADLQRELAFQPSMVASTVDVVQRRVLHYDSMAMRVVLNDLTFFEGGTVCAEKAVQFKVMAGEVTESKGAGVALISLWNYATGEVDVLSVEAQYVPDSPFNLMSAVCLEDKYGLYGQLLHRELVSTSGRSRYKLVRDGKIFILPETVATEAACPTVQHKIFRDVVNWKFTDFPRWNAEKGLFTVDMCADKHNTQLSEFYSVEDSVFDHTLAGRSFYANMLYVDTFIFENLHGLCEGPGTHQVPAGASSQASCCLLIFTDHSGPFQISLGGSRGCTIHVDDFSGLGCIYFWGRKLEYLSALQLYRDLVRSTGRAILGEDLRVEELVYDVDLLVLKSDNNSKIIAGMWPLAFRHVVYLLNRLVKAELGMLSSMDVLHQKVDLRTRRIFGCRAYAFVDAILRTKLADRATPLLYVGHDDRSSLLHVEEENRTVRDAALKQQMYDVLGTGEFLPRAECHEPRAAQEILNEQTINRFYSLFAFAEVQLTSGTEWEAAVVCTNARREHRLPYQVLLLRHCGQLAAAGEWRASDTKEECALIDVKRAIVPVKSLPAGVKSLGMKAIYKLKFDAANVLTERKSRWVVFGNKQTHGMNYEEVYSPCTQLNTLRILIQLSLILGPLAFTMDVVTCFLNGDLDLDAPLFV